MVKHKNALPRRVKSSDSSGETEDLVNGPSSSGGESSSPGGPAGRVDQYSKPMIERRRRARINEHLSQLKLLIMEDLADQPGRLSKLDKAEILEMAVRYLKKQKRKQQEEARKTVPDASQLYGAGATECLWVAHHALSGDNQISPEVRIRFLDHMATWMHRNTGNNLPEIGFLGGATWSPKSESCSSEISSGKKSPVSDLPTFQSPKSVTDNPNINDNREVNYSPISHSVIRPTPVMVSGHMLPIIGQSYPTSPACEMNQNLLPGNVHKTDNGQMSSHKGQELGNGLYVPNHYIMGGGVQGTMSNLHPAFPQFQFLYAPQLVADVNCNLSSALPGHVISPCPRSVQSDKQSDYSPN